MDIYYYLRSDPGITFDTCYWATVFAHSTMAQFVKYKFDYNTAMYTVITKFTVFNSPLNPTSNLKVDLYNLNRLPAQVKILLEYFTRVKSNHKYTYDMVCKLKDRGSCK